MVQYIQKQNKPKGTRPGSAGTRPLRTNYLSVINKINNYVLTKFSGLSSEQVSDLNTKACLAFYWLVEIQTRQLKNIKRLGRVWNVNISTALAKEIFGKEYVDLINILLDAGIISLVSDYAVDVKCRTYEVDLSNHPISPCMILNNKGVSARQGAASKRENSNMSMKIGRDELLSYMKPIISGVKLLPSQIPATHLGDHVPQISEYCWWKTPAEQKYAMKAIAGQNLDMPDADWSVWVSQTNSPRLMLIHVEDRIYHTYTNCPREMKAHIKIDGEPLIQFDVESCHPFFSFVATNSQDLIDLYRDVDIYSIITLGKQETRDDIKYLWSSWLNDCSLSYDNAVGAWFKLNYPEYYKAIRELKIVHGKDLYRVWTKMEWELIKGGIYPLLMNAGIPFLDAHDGFDVPASLTDLVITLIDEYSEKSDVNLIPDFKYGNVECGIVSKHWSSRDRLLDTQRPLEATQAVEPMPAAIRAVEPVIEAPMSLDNIMEQARREAGLITKKQLGVKKMLKLSAGLKDDLKAELKRYPNTSASTLFQGVNGYDRYEGLEEYCEMLKELQFEEKEEGDE